MKYRTVIELVCDAADKEDASNIAGDYLKGEVDFGVDMHCRTSSLWAYRTVKYTVSCVMTLFVFTALLLRVTPVTENGSVPGQVRLGFPSTSTVMPELRTKDQPEFKKEWTKKQEDTIKEKEEK